MKQVNVANTSIKVSQLCMGVLTMSPLQANFTREKYLPVVKYALENGINFFDTAQLYSAYHIVKDIISIDKSAVISSKSYAYDVSTATQAVEEALRAIGRDYIDIFIMHEQESMHTMRGHYEALETYVKLKKQGKIRAIGLSTHHVAGVHAGNQFGEIELIHPILNYQGFGIVDGSLADMERELISSKQLNKFVLAMKIFGGGHLLKERKQAIDYIISKDYVDAYAIGMMSEHEIRHNIDMLSGVNNSAPSIASKKITIMDDCTLCGKCIEKCPQNAMTIQDNCVIIDEAKCVLCSYCGSACKDLNIKIF